MTPERWAQVRDIFEGALEQTPEARGVFIHSACQDDEDLRLEVMSLIAAHDATAAFLDEPIPLAETLRRQSARPDALQDTCIGAWRLLHKLGSGGMGVVYLARRDDREFQKLAALKIVNPGMVSDDIVYRFRNERQVLASLEHPNIARLLDGGTTADGIPYLVMEYVDGLRFDEYCSSRRLSLAERLNLFCTVCSAVSYAHQNLIVHRDIKPSNIFVTKEGVPKLLDFGIAKLLQPGIAGEALRVTHATTRALTPAYASPEQLRGEPITTASDIYSLGVLLYELLTGQSPYRLDRETAGEMERAICEGDPDPPSVALARSPQPVVSDDNREKLVRRLRGDLDVIVLTALRKEPQRRYPSVERFSNDIALHLSGAPVTARPDTWAYRAEKFVGRHRIGVLLTLIVAVALIAAAGIASYYGAVAEKHKEMALKLASFVVGDFDAAMQSGVTSARKAVMQGVLNSLEELSPGANDPALRDLLIKAYIRVGDLEGNVYESNLGNAAGARESYERALLLAQAQGSQTAIAQATAKLGDVAFQEGDRKTALARYSDARQRDEHLLLQRRGDRTLPSEVIRLWYKTGLTQLQLGDVLGAQDSYRRELELSQQLVARPGATLEDRRELAKAEEHLGRLLLDSRSIPAGEQHLAHAVEIYGELLRASPTSFTARSDWAMACAFAAEGFVAQGDLATAETKYEESARVLAQLLVEDPNEQYRLWLNQIRSAYTEVLVKRHELDSARSVTQLLIADLERTTQQSNAPELLLHEYAWTLLTTPFKELHNRQAALRAAQRASLLTNDSDPAVLHLLALAWEENGAFTKAIDVERRASALLPTGAGSKRVEIEMALMRFESEAKSAQAKP
jgi:tetratricopeptide (TPR) repeat protein